MKWPDTTDTPKVTRSENFKKYDVGILNPQVLFHILTDKTYKYPLATMIQEYMSNARDAHREKGNTDRPIEIILPTDLDPMLSIKDFGIGISPERMGSVFIYLGESTKRADDSMHGGFGIGAKIGFAYSSNFHIISRYDGLETEYMAYVGEDKLGHIDEISTRRHDEEDGVTIQVPIESSDDMMYAARSVAKCCYFWRVRPELINMPDHLSIDKWGDYSVIPREQMSILHDKDADFIYRTVLHTERTPLTVVDRIIYGSLEESSEIPYQKLRKNSVVFIKTGEVDVAVSRESLQYTPKTWKVLRNIIKNNINMSVSFARGDLISAPSYELGELSRYLNTVAPRSVVKHTIVAPWGPYEISYRPGAKLPLKLKVPSGWRIYDFTMKSWGDPCDDWVRSRESNDKGEQWLPISPDFFIAIDDRNTRKPSALLANRWARGEKDLHPSGANKFFILRHYDRHQKTDEWIFEVGSEMKVSLLSSYEKKRKKGKGGVGGGPSLAGKLIFKNPYYSRDDIDTQEILNWLEESPNNILATAPKSLYNHTLGSELNSILGAKHEDEKIFKKNTRILTVTNKILYKRLIRQYENAIPMLDLYKTTQGIYRLYAYEQCKKLLEHDRRVRLIMQRLDIGNPNASNNAPIRIIKVLGETNLVDPYLLDILSFENAIAEVSTTDIHRIFNACCADPYVEVIMSGHNGRTSSRRLLKFMNQKKQELVARYRQSGTWKLEGYELLKAVNHYDVERSQPIRDELVDYMNQQYRRKSR